MVVVLVTLGVVLGQVGSMNQIFSVWHCCPEYAVHPLGAPATSAQVFRCVVGKFCLEPNKPYGLQPLEY